MRLRLLASIVLAAGAPALVAVACNQSQTPAPATATPEAMPPEAPDTTSAAPTPDEEPSAADTPEPVPGEVALPPGSASAWNTGQSDGQPGKADRGIKDYQAVIQSNRDRFRACYEQALAKHSGIKGRVTLVFVLDPKGNVKEGHIDKDSSDIVEQDLETCMVATIKALGFPPSRRGMESNVRYPFTFNPRSH